MALYYSEDPQLLAELRDPAEEPDDVEMGECPGCGDEGNKYDECPDCAQEFS